MYKRENDIKKENSKQKNSVDIKNENENYKETKMIFFKKVKISIFDFDKYYEIAGESINRTILYVAEIFIIFSFVISLVLLFRVKSIFDDFSNYKSNNSDISSYTYKITEGYELSGEQLNTLSNTNLGNIFAYFWIFTFIIYFFTGLLNILAISILGLITVKFIRLPLKYSAIFAISASAITLPTILQLIYIVVNFYTGFIINNFLIMYLLISYIYLIAAILMLRANLIKKQNEIIAKIKKEEKENTENE